MYDHILISTDGSAVAQRGVETGLALAKALGSRVTIVTATEPLQTVFADGLGVGYGLSDTVVADLVSSQKAASEAALKAGREAAGRQQLSAETLYVAEAHPAEAIVETAKSRHCSLIVMASHGRRGLNRLVLGSVTAEVLTHSPVPVLVVR